VEGLSVAQIASQISSSKAAVLNNLRSFEIPVRRANQPHGRPSQPRYGQRVKGGRTEAHLPEKRVIKTVLDLRSVGMSLRQIARYLDKAGVPTKARGKKWHPEMVNRILRFTPASNIEESHEVVCDRSPALLTS
jgi:hypothetical protein